MPAGAPLSSGTRALYCAPWSGDAAGMRLVAPELVSLSNQGGSKRVWCVWELKKKKKPSRQLFYFIQLESVCFMVTSAIALWKELCNSQHQLSTKEQMLTGSNFTKAAQPDQQHVGSPQTLLVVLEPFWCCQLLVGVITPHWGLNFSSFLSVLLKLLKLLRSAVTQEHNS